jgi:hypothetical protein
MLLDSETHHASFSQDLFQLHFAEVGDPDGLCLAGGNKLLHGLPGLDEGNILNNDPAVWCQWHKLFASAKCTRIVHEVEIDVVHVELTEAGVQCSLYVIGVMRITPKFRGDEYIASWYTAAFDTKADLSLGTVTEVLRRE